MTATDTVNRPEHYTTGKIEVIDFIEDKQLNYHRGNAIKYIVRAGIKDKNKEIEDLQKAAWYIGREIVRLNNLTPDPEPQTWEEVDRYWQGYKLVKPSCDRCKHASRISDKYMQCRRCYFRMRGGSEETLIKYREEMANDCLYYDPKEG